MSRRKDPAAAVIEFFENAQPDAAQAILGVCKSIVARRTGKAGKPKSPRNSRAIDAAGSTSPENSKL